MRWQARVTPEWSLQAWRFAARHAWCAKISPESLNWLAGDEMALLAAPELTEAPVIRPAPKVPRRFLQLASQVLCHRDARRFGLLYRLLWRMAGGERGLLARATDPDVQQATAWAQAVRRDAHQTKAFVRFCEMPGQTQEFVAWFEPEHWILDQVAPFFARRFAGMRWCLLTPYRSARWDGQTLQYGPGAKHARAAQGDPMETLWQTYYAHTFNPARLNPRAMQQHMPQKYWHLLPEAKQLPQLIHEARPQVAAMMASDEQTPDGRRGRGKRTA